MKYDNVLICPVCGEPLFQRDGSLYCAGNHCFDLSKKGYVNLLPPSGHGGHGDDRLMVGARTAFLNKGYYDRLSRAISAVAADCVPDGGLILDAGCGEGKYTAELLPALAEAGKTARILGIDISKEALIAAARRSRELCLAVASTARMPVTDASADLLLNVFSPLMTEEFARVLKPGGRLLRVVPLERHLWELKALVYERPYENDPPQKELEGFELLETRELKYVVELTSAEDVRNLFMMTPYYYKTSAGDQEKLSGTERLSLTLEFCLLLSERKKECP